MQALLITAYKNVEQLERLIHYFSSFNIYIHIDKKSEIDPSDLNKYKNVKVIKKYSIGWGSVNHLRAVIDLLKLAIDNEQNNFIHIISGQDIPVRSISDFKKFEHDNHIYMDCTSVVDLPKQIQNRYAKGTISSRIRQNSRLLLCLNIFYGLIHSSRKNIGEFRNIYKGLIWMSFPYNVADYLVKYFKNHNFISSLIHVAIPEEFAFQTILINSKFKNQIINNNIRYDNWTNERYGSLPSILDLSDYDKIINGEYYFARKADPIISKGIIQKINKNMLDMEY